MEETSLTIVVHEDGFTLEVIHGLVARNLADLIRQERRVLETEGFEPDRRKKARKDAPSP